MDHAGTLATIAYARSSRASYDIGRRDSNIILAHNTLSCNDDRLCQTILKFPNAGQSYGSDI